MVLISLRNTLLGILMDPERHENISFNSALWKKGLLESGFEINKLFFGFGLSFTYQIRCISSYQALQDNVAFKFTFNL